MSYIIEWEPAGVYSTFFGEVSINARMRSFTTICGHPRFDDLRYAITDYLQVPSYDEVAEEATEEMAAMHIAHMRTNPRIAIAAIATSPTSSLPSITFVACR